MLYNEEKFFEVNALSINRTCFEMQRNDETQEDVRRLIQEAFEEVDKCPEKYATTFFIIVPDLRWEGYRTFEELELYAEQLGGQMADWVELALAWAYRISKGEPWESICNEMDKNEWNRVIRWKNGFKIVGGSRNGDCNHPEGYVAGFNCFWYFRIANAVPLVAFRNVNPR